MSPRNRLALVLAAVLLTAGCARLQTLNPFDRSHPLLRPNPKELARQAPDSFDVRFETNRGPFVVRAHRAWAPVGVDRFYYLTRHGWFTDNRFFRIVPNFVVQWGITGDSALNAAWYEQRMLADEPVRKSNRRGTVSFARGGPNTRNHQLFINLRENVRLDTAQTRGFPAIAEVLEGMTTVVDSIQLGRLPTEPVPSQDSIRLQGNAYLARKYPKLDWIRSARITREWKR